MNIKGPEFKAFVRDMKANGWGRFFALGNKEADTIVVELAKRKISALLVGGDILWCDTSKWNGEFTDWGAFEAAQVLNPTLTPDLFKIRGL